MCVCVSVCVLLCVAGQIVYTTLRKFKDDLQTYPPDHLVCVPLVLDTLYSRVGAASKAHTPHTEVTRIAAYAQGAVHVGAHMSEGDSRRSVCVCACVHTGHG